MLQKKVAGSRDSLIKKYDEPVMVAHACNYSTDTEFQVED